MDLYKVYDRVRWIYIRLIFIHLGLCPLLVAWIVNYINFVSFYILINGIRYPFLMPKIGIRQGFPLSPLIFLIVTEGLT